jgi:DnaJ-class molecular chaperone
MTFTDWWEDYANKQGDPPNGHSLGVLRNVAEDAWHQARWEFWPRCRVCAGTGEHTKEQPCKYCTGTGRAGWTGEDS